MVVLLLSAAVAVIGELVPDLVPVMGAATVILKYAVVAASRTGVITPPVGFG